MPSCTSAALPRSDNSSTLRGPEGRDQPNLLKTVLLVRLHVLLVLVGQRLVVEELVLRGVQPPLVFVLLFVLVPCLSNGILSLALQLGEPA